MKDSSKNNFYNAYLLTGSNLGNSINYLQEAVKLIEQHCGSIITKSNYYKTAAWGFTNQPDFINQVLHLKTFLLPKELMKQLLRIEETMGRVRTQKMGPRIIDIDILLIDNLIIDTTLLKVPHPHLINRKFALTPLAEVAPNIVHAVENKSIIQLLQDCKDTLDVQKI